MKTAQQIMHAHDVEYSAEDASDCISVTADDARPGWVLVSISVDDQVEGSVYLTAEQARAFAGALGHYADEVSGV